MSSFKYLLNTLVYTTYTSVYFAISIFLYNTYSSAVYELFNELITSRYFNFFKPIKLGFMIFIFIFVISVCVYCIYKSIYNLYVFYAGNIKMKSMYITVDDDFVIRDSYIEFQNGTKIPVNIAKLSFKKIEEEKENGEEKA